MRTHLHHGRCIRIIFIICQKNKEDAYDGLTLRNLKFGIMLTVAAAAAALATISGTATRHEDE